MDDTYDDFLTAYVEAALWSSSTEDGYPLDEDYEIDDMDAATQAQMREDCKAFIAAAGHLLDGSKAEQAGHDFWLTRNGHGAGFWDRPASYYPNDPLGKVLTEIAHSFGPVDLFIYRGKVHSA